MQILYTGLQALYWICSSCAVVYMAVYLTYHGFGSEITGLVSGLSFLFSIIITHCLGKIISRRGKSSVPYLQGLGILLIPGEIALLFGTGLTPAIPLLLIFIISILLSVKGLLNSLYDELKRAGLGLDFGPARAVGSIAFALCSFLMGLFIGKTNPDIMVPVLLAFSCLLLILVFRLPRGIKDIDEIPDKPALNTGFSGRYFMLFLGCAVIFAAMNTLATFQIYIINDLGGGAGDLGILTLLVSAIEAPAMYAFPLLRKRFKTSSILSFSLLAFPFKFLFYCFARNITFIYVSVIFQFLSFGLYTPAIVEFIIEKYSKEKSGSVQLLINNMSSLGSIVGIVVSGFLISRYPAGRIILVWAVAAGLAAVLACLSIRLNRDTAKAEK